MNNHFLKVCHVGAISFVLLITQFSVLPAFAHPFTVDTEPVGFGQLQQSPDKVVITYSEPVEEGFSTIKVTDSSGNRVDNDDAGFYQDDQSMLIVTLQPLQDDVYAVTSKVLSQVDGHVVEFTYAFIVGSPGVPIPADTGVQTMTPAIFLPESLSRFPGLVGQVIIVGISFATLFLWRPIDKVGNIDSAISQIRSSIDRRFKKLLIIGVILVLASGFAMIFVQAASLGTGIETALTTNFGSTWLARMLIALIILGLYFVLRTKNPLKKIHHASILAVGIILLATTTVMGHGYATTIPIAGVLDFVHNLVASAWIGGLIYLGFVAIPSIRKIGLNFKSAIIALLIPRFSMMTVVILGVVGITGPLLLWMLESNVNSLLLTSYGKILITKISLAGFMIGVGAFNQFIIHSKSVAIIKADEGSKRTDVYRRFNKSLKVESAIGIALLLSVALLTNTSLPGGELPVGTLSAKQIDDTQIVDGSSQRQLMQTLFVDESIVNISIKPARIGLNEVTVSITDSTGKALDDIEKVQIKLTQVKEGIGPLISGLTKVKDTNFDGNATFTANGLWNIEVLAQRQTALSIAALFDVVIKPELSELQFKVEEYAMPERDSLPLYPLYNDGILWVSDTVKPRIWSFNIENKQFNKYDLGGNLTTLLDLDSKGNVWFLDPVSREFGYLTPDDGIFKTYGTPSSGLPVSLDIDFNDNVWIALLDTNKIMKFSLSNEKFEIFVLPTEESQPSAVKVDDFGTVWFAEAAAGKIGRMDPDTGNMEEFIPPTGPLEEPFALLIDEDGNIWIAEHIGPKVTRFDPTLQTFTGFLALDQDSLPYGMTLDKLGNIWFAQHVVDNLGVLNPQSNNMVDVPVPTPTSFTQWLTIDETGKIWFAEQRGSKIGSVTITQKLISPMIQAKPEAVPKLLEINYVDLVAPGMSVGIILSSLFYVKSVHDLRRSIKLVKAKVR